MCTVTATDDCSNDKYMESFKLYRRLSPINCLDLSYSPSTHQEYFQRVISPTSTEIIDNLTCTNLGLIPLNQWEMYHCTHCPTDGLYIISNPFTQEGQQQWIKKCLNDYPTNQKYLSNLPEHVDRSPLFNDKLRWLTLGYHYDWTQKTYSKQNYTPLPEDLELLSKIIIQKFNPTEKYYYPEAVIVNYYHLNSTLCGHTDHSEENLDRPLISISFGNIGIFLIGGQDKSIEPIPMRLNSGDIVIMTKQTRLAYHGIPKIIEDNSLSKILKNSDDEKWSQYWNYISKNRININIRQVY
ncbi:unnamed protein product [Didymodactylos carnosus]|uniref:Fe2OG dioxygenase domain-containing protein n=1 Tax=Didymodactylos carnosus TaxID=1234261 RepID=A0A814C295_9BILA|nr:unnamed protein product [Didymodactylos carnosus]CAF0981544.1 unnamed protein product [Didymodactylos carnosus]CAF3713787.1 unnamed protein product [Didymodactylos carnosus]CAF3752176.1 unnamed protein product [Didymodactylos carnosus]